MKWIDSFKDHLAATVDAVASATVDDGGSSDNSLIWSTRGFIGLTLVTIIMVVSYYILLRNKDHETTTITHAPLSKIGYIPVLGHINEMTEDKLVNWMDLNSQYYDGGNFEARVLGRRMIFVSTIPEYTFIMRKRPKLFRREKLFESWAYDLGTLSGLFNAEGGTWQRARRVTSSAFAPHHVRNHMFTTIKKRARTLLDLIAATNGEQIEGIDFLTTFTIFSFIELTFNDTLLEDFKTNQDNYLHSSGVAADFKKVMQWCFRRSLYPLPRWMWKTIMYDKMEREAMKSIERQKAFVLSVVDKGIQQQEMLQQESQNDDDEEDKEKETSDMNKNPVDLLDSLIGARIKEEHRTTTASTRQVDTVQFNRSKKLSDHEIFAQLYTYMVAGTETTSVVMNMVLLMLSDPEHETLLQEVRDEIARVLREDDDEDQRDRHEHGEENDDATSSNESSSSSSSVGRGILRTYKQAESCHLLNAVIKETSRIEPVAPAIFFNTQSDDTSVTLPNGYVVNPGDAILVNMRSIMRNRSIYDNPHVFNPKRWLLSSSSSSSEIRHCGITGESSGGTVMRTTDDPNQLKEMNEQFVAFGLGPRICPGMNLANMKATVLLSAIIHNFDFNVDCPRQDIKQVFRFTAQPKVLPLRFTPRQVKE